MGAVVSEDAWLARARRLSGPDFRLKIGTSLLPGVHIMVHRVRVPSALLVLVATLFLPLQAGAAQKAEDRKPSLSFRLTPNLGFTPLRVRVAVEVRGGADDFEEFYCPTVEWDWGDGTVSESGEDCDPYEAGKSSIRRRYAVEHTFRQAGAYRVVFRLKQRSRVIASSSGTVQVRAGMRDGFGG